MVKFFHQSHIYDDPFPTVTLAFFIRYPNPFSTHIASVDVLSRTLTSSHTLLTTRLILKRGTLPRWAAGLLGSRAESWVIEESEVDPLRGEVRVRTRNLDHVKIMRVTEYTRISAAEAGTAHTTTATIQSNFSRFLTNRIETYGMHKFRANVERSRQGLGMVMRALQSHRLQTLDGAVGGEGPWGREGEEGVGKSGGWEPSLGGGRGEGEEGEGEMGSAWGAGRRK